jgi:putative methionine-R-sulfoxide reductase with GAF domain
MHADDTPKRDYSSIELPGLDLPRETRMGLLVDRLWEAFGNPATLDPGVIGEDSAAMRGYSWVGFYFAPGQSFMDVHGQLLKPSAHEMLLDRRQPKPACSPIGLGGMCGRSYREAVPIVVGDVLTLEGGYIACDPRDRSEVVVPCFDEHGTVYAVLDVDGYAPHDFTEHDADRLHDLLRAYGLTHNERRAAFSA